MIFVTSCVVWYLIVGILLTCYAVRHRWLDGVATDAPPFALGLFVLMWPVFWVLLAGLLGMVGRIVQQCMRASRK